jgi:hypothetical protein
MSAQFRQVYLDLLSNQPKDDQTREVFQQMLRGQFEARLADSVERIWELPPIILREPSGIYRELLLEARDLFVAGYFYSCVAMCGVVGERLVKDMFRASVLIQRDGNPIRPTDATFDQLEHVEVRGIVHFLKEADLLGVEAAKAAVRLGELRNRYAHARGENPPADAIKAIELLHALVEGTVSAFKDFVQGE